MIEQLQAFEVQFPPVTRHAQSKAPGLSAGSLCVTQCGAAEFDPSHWELSLEHHSIDCR